MELLPPDTTVFPVGTGIDEMRLTAVLTCRACGTTYLPVMEDLCTGFQPDRAGTQTVTMSCMGQSMEFTVTLVGEGNTGTEPLQFGDVPTDAWFVDAVRYVSENELMQGTSGKRFDPNGTMTRAMLVTVLWRYAGRPESGSSHFTDVPEGEWYAKAVAWAAEEGIVRGVTRDIFDPAGNVTREQMAAILYRYTSKTGSDTSAQGDLSGFADQSAMETYAVEAMRWAVAEGIIHGTVKGGQLCLLPKGNATRAEVATILMRYIEDFLK